MIGAKLAHYEITAHLGSGGMGDVYQATDLRLGRSVAIKLLPAAFASDTERLSRFRREAQVLASLNHPNVAHIYGLEESGETRCIVMELVDGETLQARLKRGPVAIDEALKIAKQIAQALDAAHEKGVVHRDLKPGNVMLTNDGTVKVLDFGLAKAYESVAPGANVSNSPTMISLGATNAGVILGTAAYMPPEQARGKPVDKRTDIWAFGCVLYELLTGKQAFPGEDTTEILAAVVKADPDWNALPQGSPTGLLQRCLEKDPKRRLRDIGDAVLEPERREAPPGVISLRGQRPITRHPLVWALILIAAASLAFAILKRPAAVQTTTRLTISLPPGQEITSYPAISADGRTVAYVTQQGTEDSLLYLRDLNSFESRAVMGSSGARQPFFSPDGKWVAFFAQGLLQKAEVSGGAPIRLAEASNPLGGTWGEDNTIIYTPVLGSGLFRIPASGGTPESLTKPDGAVNGYAHVFPRALPGGRSVFFTTWGQKQGGAVLNLDSRQWELVLPQSGPNFSAAIFDATEGVEGRLLLSDPSAGIRAGPFNAAHPVRTTVDTSVLTDVYFDVENEAQGWLAISNNRTAVYAAGNPGKTSLVWVDREGKVESQSKDQDLYREAALSPDGTKAVVRHGLDLWIHDLQRGTRTRLTSGAVNTRPVWSRDGTQVFFASNRAGKWDIYSQPTDASHAAEVALIGPYDQFPSSILNDGTLLYLVIHPKTARDLWIRTPDGKTTPLRVTPSNEMDGQFSPSLDGHPKWVAYASDESGRSEVYVQSYPRGANRTPVSTSGGFMPRWSRDGKELFYATGNAIVAVDVRQDGTFGSPHTLFDRSNYFLGNGRFHSYDVSPDGKRLLMIQRDAGSIPRQLNVILNWSVGAEKTAH